MKYKKNKLSDIAEVFTGYAFKSKDFNESEEGYLLIRGKNVSENMIRKGKDAKYWKKILDDKIESYILRENDIVIGMDGSKVGKNFAILSDEDLPALLVQRVARIRSKNSYNQNFLYYQISNGVFSHYINSIKTGTSIPHINKKQIGDFVVVNPPYKIQEKIVNIINPIDKKILLNKQIISFLEETATTLFNHWFIDFEFPDKNGNPYKSNGGKMIESEVGEIPEGWEVSSLKNITEIIMGQSPKGTSYNNENIGLPLINGASDFKNGFVNPKKYTTEPKKVTKQTDIIFGVRATIGNPTIVRQEYAIGRGAGIARVTDNHYQEFVFLLLEKMFKYFANTGSGSVYINISKNDFESYKFVHPSLELILKFHESVMSIFELIANKRSEIESLKELRDTLLPKLLSGEIELE